MELACLAILLGEIDFAYLFPAPFFWVQGLLKEKNVPDNEVPFSLRELQCYFPQTKILSS